MYIYICGVYLIFIYHYYHYYLYLYTIIDIYIHTWLPIQFLIHPPWMDHPPGPSFRYSAAEHHGSPGPWQLRGHHGLRQVHAATWRRWAGTQNYRRIWFINMWFWWFINIHNGYGNNYLWFIVKYYKYWWFQIWLVISNIEKHLVKLTNESWFNNNVHHPNSVVFSTSSGWLMIVLTTCRQPTWGRSSINHQPWW